MKINLKVNGKSEDVDAPADAVLLDVLREHLFLRGVKEGCREGECGACTVLVDGKAIDSCIYAAAAAQGAEIETVEANDQNIKRHIQDAMIELNGVQCGFCTPGFVVMMTALLRRFPDPDEETVKDALAGNICRCTGYSGIIDAAMEAARRVRAHGDEGKAA